MVILGTWLVDLCFDDSGTVAPDIEYIGVAGQSRCVNWI